MFEFLGDFNFTYLFTILRWVVNCVAVGFYGGIVVPFSMQLVYRGTTPLHGLVITFATKCGMSVKYVLSRISGLMSRQYGPEQLCACPVPPQCFCCVSCSA